MFVSGGKKCSFFGKFGVLCFLETTVLRFTLLPDYRQLDVWDSPGYAPDEMEKGIFTTLLLIK